MTEQQSQPQLVATQTAPPAGEDHPVSRVQADMFCHDCGANLYGRSVWRTPDTGLLVARCGQCGRLWPANEALPYRRVWRQRLGVAMMLGWFGILGLTLLAFIWTTGYMEHSTVAWGYAGYGTPGGYVIEIDWPKTWTQFKQSTPVCVILSFVGGCLLACTVYHWRRWWYCVGVLFVHVCALVIVFLAWNEMDSPGGFLQAAAPVVLLMAGLQAVAGIAGVLVGRPIGRTVIRMLLPNRSRQFFAFLWRRDGKEVPLGRF